ncbi:SusC/RagA family TonB-linked outer membrane protein [Segetibacter sp. 3557_3]|uniref:SusC/RagA family TonB-linked outer membrane protein n=1 Tax=Segetibacter sp. 3557_3 TaxID=2547429 RepID=UPI001FB6B05E|nr:TonB-dependent receptor [Segetibacter sp. 3557_3]
MNLSLFKGMGFFSKVRMLRVCMFLLMVGYGALPAMARYADIIIKGKVTSGTGESLAGVSVEVKGTTVGASTDVNGNFTVTADESATLVFSYVGYGSQEVLVNNRSTINVTMSTSSGQLEQVVVVGYGTQRKRDLTGSVTSVKGEDVARMPNTNPIASLQGKVAGLTITNSGNAGSSPVVRIRGINSTNSASPVYVVDGVLHDNIDFLNPADIETIDVLRDPSSIAIYGLRGANGVIAITSKKAARGQTRVNFTSSLGVQRVINRIAVTDAEGFKKLYAAQLSNLGAAPFDFTNYTANTNWQDEIFRDALININSLGFSNSSEKSTTLLNIGYTNQDGVLKYDNYKRYLVRLNEEIRFNDKIKVGGSITGFHWISNPEAAGLNNALWAAPIVPIKTDTGTYYSMPSFQRAQVGNPVAALNRNTRTSISKGFRIVGSLFAEVKFLKSFTWRSTVYTDLGFNNSRDYSPLPFAFVNLGEGTNPTTTTYDNTVRTGVSQSQSESKRFQQDHTLTFDKKLGSDHALTVLAGFTSIYSHGSSINGNRRDTTVNVPNNPDFWYLSTININNPGAFGGGGSESSIVGAFGRVSYAYKGKYLLNATLRRDGSSKFAPENRWGTFSSLGVGWVVTDDSFFNNVKTINFLKLRGAWGETGNANGFADNLYRPGISNASTAVFGNNVYTAIQASYIPDPNLHWEVVRGFDVGLDMKMFNNRLNAELNLYDRTTTDILTALTLPNESRSYFTNLGKITNKGIELSLGWSDKIGKDFTYSFSPNFSYNENVVNSIGDKTNFQLIGNNGANLTETGKSIGYFYGYRQTGIYQTTADITKSAAFTNSLPGDIAFADINGDGLITSADRTYLGTPFPPYSFGLSLSFGYKGFDAMFEGQGVAGNKIYTQRRIANFTVLNYESNRLNAWTTPGSTNIEPILDNSRGNNYLFSSYYLEPGDYFRIRTVQIGYTFGRNALSFLGIQKARIYLSGQNIVSWSQVTGYTPEAQIGSILGGGADNGVYPVPATYSFGVNVNF